MKNIKHLLLLISIVVSTFFVKAQSALTIDASQLFSSFKYTDKDGNILNNEYQGIFTGAYSIGYRYVADFGLIVKPVIGMRNGGASLVYDGMNYSWKLQYANVKLGLGYMYKTKRVNPYFVASGYYAYLLRGMQTLNNEDFNITESELLNKTDYGVVFTPGVEIKLSDFVSTYIEFNYLMGLANIEMDEGQVAKNISYGISLGLSFSISQKNKTKL